MVGHLVTEDDERALLDEPKRMTQASLLELAERAGMDVYALNTNVIKSDDGLGRIGFSSGDPIWGDHLRLEWMPEATPGKWLYAHFSADKIELLARKLLERANAMRKARSQEGE